MTQAFDGSMKTVPENPLLFNNFLKFFIKAIKAYCVLELLQ